MAAPEQTALSEVLTLIERRAGLSLSGALAARLPGLLEEGAARQGVSVERFAASLRATRGAGELEGIIEALVVHETGFFRHAAQIDALQRRVLPERMAAAAKGGRPLRLWSAGCSTGEEAYTLAMLLLAIDAPAGSEVLATDISPRVLHRAKEGRFSQERITGLEQRFGASWLRRDGDDVVVSDAVKALVRFQRLNLATDPFPRDLDVVLCRNVLIYFSQAARTGALRRLGEALRPQGWLLLGYSESVRGESAGWYERVDAGEAVVYRRREVRAPAIRTLPAAPEPPVTPPSPSEPLPQVPAPAAPTRPEPVARVTLCMPTDDAHGLRAAVARALRDGARHVSVDLDTAEYLTSRDALALERAVRFSAEQGATLLLIAVRQATLRFIQRFDLSAYLRRDA